MTEQQDITPEGSVVSVFLDPTPREPVEVPNLISAPPPIRQQSPNGQWWEQRVNDAGQPEWVPVDN